MKYIAILTFLVTVVGVSYFGFAKQSEFSENDEPIKPKASPRKYSVDQQDAETVVRNYILASREGSTSIERYYTDLTDGKAQLAREKGTSGSLGNLSKNESNSGQAKPKPYSVPDQVTEEIGNSLLSADIPEYIRNLALHVEDMRTEVKRVGVCIVRVIFISEKTGREIELEFFVRRTDTNDWRIYGAQMPTL